MDRSLCSLMEYGLPCSISRRRSLIHQRSGPYSLFSTQFTLIPLVHVRASERTTNRRQRYKKKLRCPNFSQLFCIKQLFFAFRVPSNPFNFISYACQILLKHLLTDDDCSRAVIRVKAESWCVFYFFIQEQYDVVLCVVD